MVGYVCKHYMPSQKEVYGLCLQLQRSSYGSKGPLEVSSPALCSNQVRLDQFALGLTQWAFEYCQDIDATNSLFQC